MQIKVSKQKSSKSGFGINSLRLLLIFGVAFILFGIGYCGFKIYTLSDRQENIKRDFMLVHNVSFGLLSIDEWKDNILAAAKAQIQKFKLTPKQNEDLTKEVETILHGLIEKVVTTIRKPQKSLGGKIEKFAFNTLVSVKKLHQQVPEYSKKIIEEINKPASYNRLKSIAQTELDSMGSKTYDSSKLAVKTLMDSIFQKYNTSDKTSFENQSAAELTLIRKQQYSWAFGMLGGVILILILWWFVRNKPDVHTPLYIMSILSALILLVVGLTTTMIQIDARIESMNFHLLGENISFKNQVLFFQSKSIVDVVHILIQTGKIDSMIVGILILAFSILFPIAKLLSTGIYMLNKKKWAKNKVIHFFAFESGKWSMADVLVIAILMTYIGFNGIVNSTLTDLNMNDDTITSITTNNTSIQPGYIIFIGFVLYGFTLSSILKNISHFRHIIVLDQK